MDNTIFDDCFRTLMEKMPQLVLPLINEVFGTEYGEDTQIIPLQNEHMTPDGKRTTDNTMQIGNKIYHLECQSNTDSSMVIRMIEYDFHIAMNKVTQKDGNYYMDFPRSCVLYLRHNKNTQDKLKMKLCFPDGSMHEYTVPVIKVQEYTKSVIFQKKLFFLLPFYIMRYEKEKEEIERDEEKLNALLIEYEEIRRELDATLNGEQHTFRFGVLVELITRISDYIFREDAKTKKGLGEIMGGKVLELKTIKAYDEGEKIGEKRGIIKGRSLGKIEAYLDAGYSMEAISEKMNLPPEKVMQIVEEMEEVLVKEIYPAKK